jgi:hypothetical protein
MTVRDVSDRPADLHTLAAPALHQVDALTADFQVPEDRPGGLVSGRSKTFTQSIRPLRDDIDVIEPVPFSFFNPDTGAYETVFGPPIPIAVRTGRTLRANDLTGLPATNQAEASNLTSVHGGLLANVTDPKQLLQQESAPSTFWLLAIVIVPPLVFVGTASTRRLSLQAQANPDRVRARRAHKKATLQLNTAGDDAAGVAQAIATLVCDRLNLPQGMMRADLTTAIAQHDRDAAQVFDTCMQSLEALTFGGNQSTIDAPMRAQVDGLMTKINEVTR